MPRAFAVFDSAIGACGIAWSVPEDVRGAPVVVGFQLPEATRQRTESRIARRAEAPYPIEPPPVIAAIIARVCRHLEGAVDDFRDVLVDLTGLAPFARQVYEAIREIPPGRTVTYGELAATLEQPTAAQAVGRALGRNPIPLIIPCHRVLAARGRTGGFSAHGGSTAKVRLLAIEGAGTGGLPLFDR